MINFVACNCSPQHVVSKTSVNKMLQSMLPRNVTLIVAQHRASSRHVMF